MKKRHWNLWDQAWVKVITGAATKIGMRANCRFKDEAKEASDR